MAITIRKSSQMLELESEHGKAIEQLIADTITETGSIPRAAGHLGVNVNTFYGWMRYLRIQIRTIATCPG